MTKTLPPLLFLHGFRGNHLGLEAIAKQFPGHQVHLPDIPPTGKTPLKTYDPQSYATWIANYIIEHQLDRPILIGHSMGSILAAATAAKFPELINDKIVFLSPISQKPPRFLTYLMPGLIIVPNKLIGYLVTKYLLIPKDRQLLAQTLDLTYRCYQTYTSRLDTVSAAKFSMRYAISDFNFDRTAIFIAGTTDRLNSQKQTRAVAKKYHAETIFLPDSGHLINYECPELVAEAIHNFLDQK
ncbi:MAG: alpha/beta hydrolase [Candidatus Saccharibacteria bacterium]|nr:alpha/beta hydrolase [Candidatus Saccharibacteria bacterium]